MIAVLVSGGIDSLMAARVLKHEGERVIGLHLRTGYNDLSDEEVRLISERAGMPVETIDCRDAFQSLVVDYFIAAYLEGETPNPCLRCNPTIKFGLGLDYALNRGADSIATGHYCMIRREGGHPRLARGLDQQKDQSYFLALVTEAQLSRLCFPVGGMTKAAVQSLAREMELAPVVARESQDVCFIGREETYADLIGRQVGLTRQPGLIEDIRGNVIGEHGGVHLFTVGQRRGINCPAAKPYYVASIDRRSNRIRVGFREDLMIPECRVRAINWIGRGPDADFTCTVKVRYQHRPAPARVTLLPDFHARLTFEEPQFGVAPGQGAVFYENDIVLGGGIITVG
ncbi:MAG: tRNA 2-thiouridine(34) synthase MnmA [Thermodesulfobacteriota bacterium]